MLVSSRSNISNPDEEVGVVRNPSAHESVEYRTPAGFGRRTRYNELIYVPNVSARDYAVRFKQTLRTFVENAPNLVGILAGVAVIGISAAILYCKINWSNLYACDTARQAVVEARPHRWAADFKSCLVYWNLTGENGEMAGVTVSGEFVGPNRAFRAYRHQPYRVFITSDHGILKVRSVYIEDKP